MTYESRRHRWRRAIGLLRGEVTPYVALRLTEVLLLVLFGAAMNALAPLAMKWIIDGLSGQGRFPLGAGVLVGFYAVSQWLGRSSVELRTLRYARAERRVLRTLNERLFSHVLRLPLRYHLTQQTGAVSQTIDNGLEGVRLILHHLVFTVLPVCAEMLLSAYVLGRLRQPVFLVLFCGAALCYAVIFGRSARRIGDSARDAAATRVAAGAVMTDGLLNFETVKAFAAERLVTGKAGRALERSEAAWVHFYRRYARNGLAVAAVFTLFLAATLICAVHAVRTRSLTVGGFVLVNTYMLQLVRPAEMLGFAVQGFAQGAALLEKAMALLTVAPEPAAGVSLPDTLQGTLEFDRVTLRYAPGRAALEAVSFTVAAGSTLGIVGQSGSGKSSIVRLLLRLIDPESGEVRLGGFVLSGVAPQALRSAIAVVPQDVVLFDDSIEFNIAVAKPRASREEVHEAARIAQLEEFVGALPEGYDTVVGERGVRLSGGERQRIAIARAALRRPLVYVFDEATAALDSRTEQAVLASLRAMAGAATTVLIAHRLASVVHAECILVLHAGRVVECGRHEALLQAGGRYAALWAAQHPGTAAA
ncbi:MAG: ABC transporter ATP-binding protein [Pseudomonadota bacterium]|nr:ABC transporter ATP-binding protein [Pseudomonadota bacterium]